MVARGRKKSKYGKMVTFYLSNDVIAMLRKRTQQSGKKQTDHVEDLIREDFAKQTVTLEETNKVIQEVLGGGLTEHKSYLINKK